MEHILKYAKEHPEKIKKLIIKERLCDGDKVADIEIEFFNGGTIAIEHGYDLTLEKGFNLPFFFLGNYGSIPIDRGYISTNSPTSVKLSFATTDGNRFLIVLNEDKTFKIYPKTKN